MGLLLLFLHLYLLFLDLIRLKLNFRFGYKYFFFCLCTFYASLGIRLWYFPYFLRIFQRFCSFPQSVRFLLQTKSIMQQCHVFAARCRAQMQIHKPHLGKEHTLRTCVYVCMWVHVLFCTCGTHEHPLSFNTAVKVMSKFKYIHSSIALHSVKGNNNNNNNAAKRPNAKQTKVHTFF